MLIMNLNKVSIKLITALIVTLLLLPSLSIISLHVAYAREKIIRPELKFEFWSLPWFPQSDKAAEVIVSQLAKVGIKLELRRLESSIMYPKIEKFEYQAYALATSQSPNPMSMVNSFHSSRAKPDIGSFWCMIDPEVDKLIEQARVTMNREKLKTILYEIQKKVAVESGFIPIYLTQSVKVIRAEWKNYTIMPGGLVEAYDIWSMLYMYKSEKPEENVFKIAFPSDILTTNPFMTVDLRSIWVVNLIYDPLLRLDKDMNIVPWLAVSWNISEDGKVYVFKLRRGVYWHDGKPFTADDVVATFKEGIKQGTTRFVDLKDIISDVVKVDDYTVKFILKHPYPFFLLDLASGYIYIAPKHIIEGKDLKKWANPTPIGTGPFMWKERVAGEYIILEKNPNFWMKNVPKITKVVVKVIPEAESRFMAIKTGEVDTERYDTAITLIPQAKKDPHLKVVAAPGLWLVYIDFNVYNFFYDPDVFLAINYAINRTEVIIKANGGYGYPVYTILNKWWHKDLAANITFPYNPKKAMEILEKAGWRDVDGDGIREYAPATPTPSPTPSPTPTPTPTPTQIEINLTGVINAVNAVSRSVGNLSAKIDTLSKDIYNSFSSLTNYLIAVIILLIIDIILTVLAIIKKVGG